MFRVIRKTLILLIIFLSFSYGILIHLSDTNVRSDVLVSLDNQSSIVSEFVSNQTSTTTKNSLSSDLTTFYNNLAQNDKYILATDKFNCTSIACTSSSFSKIGLFSISEYDKLGGINSYLASKQSYFAIDNGTIKNITSSGIEETSTSSGLRPAIYLQDYVTVTGSGTQSDPFKLKMPEYVVTINLLNGTVTLPSKMITRGESVTFEITPNTGYKLVLSSNTCSSGTLNGNIFTITNVTENQTCNISLMPESYTLTFEPNGGSISSTTTTVTYDSTYGELPTPVKEGYTFSGWYTASNGGTKVESTTQVKTASNHTLYAQWTLNKYTLTLTKSTGVSTIYYKINGDTSYTSATSTQSLSVNYGTTYTYYGVAETGYTISSCTESSPCTGTMGTSAITKTLSATLNKYTLTLTKGTGVSTIYYKINGATSYSSATSTQSLSVNYGTTYTYYGVASTGYTMSSCTASSPCTGTMGTSAVSRTLSATLNKYTLTLTKGTGVSTIYYKINGATSYSSATSTQSLSVNYGSTYTYYGVAATGYTMSSCTASSPCTGTMGTSAVSRTLSATLNKYTLTLTKGTGVSTIYYKINGATSYSSATSTQSLSVNYGTTYTYYGVASTGYVMTTCTASSPCSGTMGASAVSKTLTATKGYTVTLNIVNGTGSATQIVAAGSNATFTGITPNSGYIISDDDWDADFSITSTDTNGVYKIVLKNITSNTNYTFKFVYEGYSNITWDAYRARLAVKIDEKLDTNANAILSNMVIEENDHRLVGVISTEVLLNLNLLSSESSEICADFNVSGGCVIVSGHRLTGVRLTIIKTQTGTNTYVYNIGGLSEILD